MHLVFQGQEEQEVGALGNPQELLGWVRGLRLTQMPQCCFLSCTFPLQTGTTGINWRLALSSDQEQREEKLPVSVLPRGMP